MSYDNPPPPPPPQYGAPMPGAVPGTNKKAIWSLVTGIVGLLCCGLLGIAAIILGQQAKKEIATSGEGGGGIVAIVFMVIQIILAATGNGLYDLN